ncbi:hypothetical protein SAMD00019534_076510 [Acytostelium subglobosum LB1]|uniref:hypothetical protein n=1 Tax=Acytostelium subglobosum LB1 TaxID=1410327 RepID=UPI000644FB6D|nr:hypothetical protein SAMD00019534_076510 [Acytostelium subglobosum LB1]GAM24476.1 hypothetical protein SAMD00019534_076510 [Acytostelium subglobosum LB1]|eukprot:XP_012752802.1 hypothetical protein SAMD00019534_076510 [Acytostelium subglobosum LB1]
MLNKAIMSGNREVINMLYCNRKDFSINFSLALEKASEVGDIDTIRMIVNTLNLRTLYSEKVMINLIKQVGVSGSKITEEVIVEIGKQFSFPNNSYIVASLLIHASAISGSLVKTIINHFTSHGDKISDYNRFNFDVRPLLSEAFKAGKLDSIEYLLELAQAISKCELEEKLNTKDLFPYDISNVSILSFLLEKGYLNVGVDRVGGGTTHSRTLEQIVDNACSHGLVEIIHMIHQRCTTKEQLRRHLPSYHKLYEASMSNHHQVLSYLFEGDQSPFIQAGVNQHSINSLLLEIKFNAWHQGNMKILAMCNRLIKLDT